MRWPCLRPSSARSPRRPRASTFDRSPSRRRWGRGSRSTFSASRTSSRDRSVQVPTEAKVQSIEALKERLGTASSAVLTEYRGLTVRQLSDLRKQLKAASAEYKVVKNRIAKLAVADTPLRSLAAHLKGPTAMVLSRQDPVAVAKALQGFARTNQALAIK